MMVECILVLLVVLLVIVDRRKSRKLKMLYEEGKTDYPNLPVIGQCYLFLGDNEVIMKRFQDLARMSYQNKHGLCTVWMGNMLYTVISDPEAAKPLFKLCDKGHLMRFWNHLIGNGSIFAPVNIWLPRRKILIHAAATKYINKFHEVFVRNSNVMVEELQSVSGKGDFSFYDYFCSYSLNSACETVYGKDLVFQKNLHHPFFCAFVKYFENLEARIFKFWLHSNAVYEMLPVHKRQTKAKKIIHDFCKNLINERKKDLRALKIQQFTAGEDIDYPDEKKNYKTFLELLTKISGGDKGYTDVELLEETLVLLLAATDTTASAGCFILLLLSQYPDVQDKVYKEICEVFGDSNREIAFDDISKLEYLDAVVKESLRLYPPGPVIMKKCDKDIELPSGLVIYEDLEVFINIWGIHRNPRYWGADADNFKPERFISATPEQLAAFVPFSYGSRNCIGYSYAMRSLKVALVTILRRYRINPATSYTYDKGFRVKFDITLKHVDNFEVRIENRLRKNVKC